MIWEYGNYKFDCNLQPPTVDKFNQWKNDFFKLKNINKYEVWLTGGFIEDWETRDIDILLTGNPDYKELKNILVNGIALGVSKYNMVVDLQHSDTKPSLFNKGLIKKIVCGNKIIQDGRLINSLNNFKEVYSGLYEYEKKYPTKKQMKRIYKKKPILLKD